MSSPQKKSTALNVALWIAQALVALLLVGTGIFKLITPVAQVAALWPWAGEYPTLLRITGVVDLLGGLGLVLPALTRIWPGLTVLAALGCALLQVCAIGFHLSRGEGANTPFNLVMLALALFILWGRRSKGSISAQG